ncbi:hypothetical protein CKM354_001019900 [Cercospora kikuchii]|uniref:Uncharacterized protein n=1 Tax=Cercospora kikuchii TaxID=84275 RepID=A0A9P3FKH0_9PEZI|nr:uncharacterized protein CKM354_001019900 [Cercospora kikuchii]GIZ47099.1 hypothetical protein CKM354_001019900 [Cercospora kikuchii]
MNDPAFTQNGLRTQEVPHIAQRPRYQTADLNFTKQSPEEILNQVKALTITYGHTGPREVPFKLATQDLTAKDRIEMENTASRLSGQLWEVTNPESITHSVIREHVEVYDYGVHIWNIE